MRTLNVIAMTVSPDPKITNAGASVSATAHGIASSAIIPDSRRVDRPERVCQQRSLSITYSFPVLFRNSHCIILVQNLFVLVLFFHTKIFVRPCWLVKVMVCMAAKQTSD